MYKKRFRSGFPITEATLLTVSRLWNGSALVNVNYNVYRAQNARFSVYCDTVGSTNAKKFILNLGKEVV